MAEVNGSPNKPRILSFSTYDCWEGTEAECPKCGWRGQLSHDHMHMESTCMEVLCSNCSEPVAYIWFPTKAEAVAAQDETTVMMFEVMEVHSARYHRECLKSPDQLPEIDDDEIYIIWDTIESSKTNPDSYTCFKHNETILFREPPIFESGGRYREVATIFREKYGRRLIDIIPTWGGWLYLGGDSFRSLYEAQNAREEFFGKPSQRANA